MFILKLFKFEMTNEDNQREISKIINDSIIIEFLFPNLKMSSFNIPCFSNPNSISEDGPLPKHQDTVESFLKVFNSPHTSQLKRDIELRCKELLLEEYNKAEKTKKMVFFLDLFLAKW